MAITRRDIDETQWFELQDRPAHGVIRRIARDSAKAQRGSDPLEAEDVLVAALVSSWSINDDEDNPLQFKRADFDRVPQDTWSTIVDACTDVLEANIPNPTARGG